MITVFTIFIWEVYCRIYSRKVSLTAKQGAVISERIYDDIPPKNEHFEHGYPQSNVLLSLIGALQAALSRN